MRKILTALFVISIIGLVANFSLWYVNNRAVIEALETAKKALAKESYQLDYDTVVFNTFKAWDLRGDIIGLSIAHKPVGEYFSSDKIKFHFLPSQNELVIQIIGNTEYGLKHNIYSSEYFVKYPESTPPTLKLKLDIGMRGLVNLIVDRDIQNLGKLESITLNIQELFLIDKKTNTRAYSMSEIEMRMTNSLVDEMKAIQSDFEIKMLGMDTVQDYKSEYDADGSLAKIARAVGANNIEGFFTVLHNLKDGGDFSSKVSISSVKIYNEKFKISLSGDASKKRKFMVPFFNLKLVVENFSFFFDYYVDYLNQIVIHSAAMVPGAQVSPFSSKETKAIKDNLASYINADNQLILDVVTNDEGMLYISGKPFSEILLSMQMILLEKAATDKKSKHAAQPNVGK